MNRPIAFLILATLATPGALGLTYEYGDCGVHFAVGEPHRCGDEVGFHGLGCDLEATLYGRAGSDCDATH